MTDLADVAAALADRTRARMLEELLGGPPLPAGALAVRVGVAPSTVSAHLRTLERAGPDHDHEQRPQARGAARRPARRRGAGGARQHRGRPRRRPVGLKAVNRRHALREARSCYDHLAGRAGVALADQLLDHGALHLDDGAFAVPADAAATTASASASTPRRLHTRRPLVRACSDWTERRPHVAGALGKALLDALLADGTLRRRPDGRALNVTRDFLSDDRR